MQESAYINIVILNKKTEPNLNFTETDSCKKSIYSVKPLKG